MLRFVRFRLVLSRFELSGLSRSSRLENSTSSRLEMSSLSLRELVLLLATEFGSLALFVLEDGVI